MRSDPKARKRVKLDAATLRWVARHFERQAAGGSGWTFRATDELVAELRAIAAKQVRRG